MVEGEMSEVSEEEMLEALKIAHEAIKIQCKAQIELDEGSRQKLKSVFILMKFMTKNSGRKYGMKVMMQYYQIVKTITGQT